MRRQRKYSLFEVQVINGKRHYHQISDLALPLDAARRFFQGALLAGSLYGNTVLERCLRPVETVSDMAQKKQ